MSTRYCLEDLPRAIADKVRWWVRINRIRAVDDDDDDDDGSEEQKNPTAMSSEHKLVPGIEMLGHDVLAKGLNLASSFS